MCFVTENKWPAISVCSSESHQFVTQLQHIHYYPIFSGLPRFCRRCEFFESLSAWRSNSLNLSLSHSDNLLHMCHPVTSLGKTLKALPVRWLTQHPVCAPPPSGLLSLPAWPEGTEGWSEPKVSDRVKENLNVIQSLSSIPGVLRA